jgi:hypothetical protein
MSEESSPSKTPPSQHATNAKISVPFTPMK